MAILQKVEKDREMYTYTYPWISRSATLNFNASDPDQRNYDSRQAISPIEKPKLLFQSLIITKYPGEPVA